MHARWPLPHRSARRLRAPPRRRGESRAAIPVIRLARSLAAGASSQDEARRASSAGSAATCATRSTAARRRTPPACSRARSGYCTGVARLAVALLQRRRHPGARSPWLGRARAAAATTAGSRSTMPRAAGRSPIRCATTASCPPPTCVWPAETVSNAVAEAGAVSSREQRLAGIDRQAGFRRRRAPGAAAPSAAAPPCAWRWPARRAAPPGSTATAGAVRWSLVGRGGPVRVAWPPAATSWRSRSPTAAWSRRSVELHGRVRAEMLFPALGRASGARRRRRGPGDERSDAARRYDHRAIEAKWQERWERTRAAEVDLSRRPATSSTC